jgi:hypothetical protein
MTYLWLSFPFLENIIAGYYFVSVFFSGIPESKELKWIKLFLGAGIAVGLFSLTSFLWQLSINRWFVFYHAIEISLVIICVLVGMKIQKQKGKLIDNSVSFSKKSYVIPAAFALCSFVWLLTFVTGVTSFPNGSWDAWAIWDLGARFLFLGNHSWKNAFSPALFHPDYPLLLANVVARGWRYVGNANQAVPILVAFFYAVITLGLVVATLKFLRGSMAGWIAGLMLLCSSAFAVQSATLCADIPLSFYILATIILLFLYTKWESPRLLILSGVTTGLATWTKNEGWLFLVVVLIAQFIMLPLINRERISIKLSWFFLGMTLVLPVVIYFKVFLAPPNDLVSGQGIATLPKLFDSGRYFQIMIAFIQQGFQFTSKYSAPIGLFLLFVITFGVQKKIFINQAVQSSVLLIMFLLAGYFLVYLTTPYDLSWHIGKSLYRVYLQIWPLAVFITSIVIKLPASLESKPA